MYIYCIYIISDEPSRNMQYCLLPCMKFVTICRPWIDDLWGKMTQAQKDELRYKRDDSIKMVNKYVDGSGTLRVWWPYVFEVERCLSIIYVYIFNMISTVL